MAEHLSLRDDTDDGHGEEEEEGEESVVDLANDDQDDDEMSGISDEHQGSSSTSIAHEHEQATSSTSIAPPHAGNNPPGKKTGTAKNASTNKALKNLASFGDFKFQSSSVSSSTRSNIATPLAQSNSAVIGVSKVAEPKKKAVKKVAKGGKKGPVGSKVKPSAAGQKKGKACSSNESIASCVVSAKKSTSRSRNSVVQQEAPLNSPPAFDQERFQQSVSEAAAAAATKATRIATAELKRDHKRNVEKHLRRHETSTTGGLEITPSKYQIYSITILCT